MKRIARFFLCLFSLAFLPSLAHAADKIRIAVYGDDLTSGYQLHIDSSYPGKLQKRLQDVGFTNFEVMNMSGSGMTTADGVDRLSSLLLRQPDIIVLALGGNDALRGVNPSLIHRNLATIIGRLRERNPYIVLAGVKAPANLGYSYGKQLEDTYSSLADTYGLPLYPSLLEGVDTAELTLADGYHPSAKGVDVMVEGTFRMVDTGLRWVMEVRQQQQQQPVVLPNPGAPQDALQPKFSNPPAAQ